MSFFLKYFYISIIQLGFKGFKTYFNWVLEEQFDKSNTCLTEINRALYENWENFIEFNYLQHPNIEFSPKITLLKECL